MNRPIRNKLSRSTILISTVALLWGIVLALPATAQHPPPCPKVRFPATGQTTAYQADLNDGISGNFVDVPDDGTVQAGKTLSYRDNGDGTITDENTGLVWEKKSDDGGLHDKNNRYRWSGSGETIWDWLEDINSENGKGFAGHSDWRIPNIRELQSIIDYGQDGLNVDPVFNTNCTPGTDVLSGSCVGFHSWSSTTVAHDPSRAWTVDFTIPQTFTAGKDVAEFEIRAVRGGCN
jgi:hypothetical protein